MKRRSRGELVDIALRLYDLGFNVIPVDSNKRPLCSWSSEKRILREELVRLLDKATGIGIVGGLENPFKPVSVLVIVDVDKPSVLDKSPALKSLVETTVSWFTGPRCPKCEEKHLEVLEPGARFKCPKCNTEFTLSEAKRGIGLLIHIDRDVYEKYFKSTRRLGDVEFLVNNYQLIPPSLHPSGVRYEWIRPFKFEEPNHGVRPLVESEVESLLEELGEVIPVVTGIEEEREVQAPRLRELSVSEILRIANTLREAYRTGFRQYLWLFLSGWAAKARISPVSITKVLKILYEESGDSDSLKTRASAIIYSYKKAGVDISQYYGELEELLGVKPYGLEREISEADVKGKSGLREILEETLGVEKAKEAIRELREIFKLSVVEEIEKGIIEGDVISALREYIREVKKTNINFIADSIARYLINTKHVKTVVVNDNVLGVYCYRDGYYYECEEELLGELERIYRELGLALSIRSYTMLRNNFRAIIEDATKCFRGFNHTLLLFKNSVIDWRCIVYNNSLCIEEPSPELMILHKIPWEIDISVLEKHLITSREELVNAIESDLKEIIDVFKQWVGDKWILLVEIIGYTLLAGEYPLNKAIMLVGEGSNGKSTYLELVRRLLGRENYTSVRLQDLTGESRFSASQLYSKMANIYADLPSTLLKETGQFKIITGQDPVTADRKYRDPLTFVNYAKLLFSCNELPRVLDMTSAFWSRWIVIDFPNKFPKNEEFKRKLFGEMLPKYASKLLAYSLLAVKHVVNSGKFSFEESEVDYREKWLRETNTVYAFISDMLKLGVLVRDENSRVETSELYEMYVKYCENEDKTPLDKRQFTIELERLGHRRVKVKGIYYYKGLKKTREWIPEESEN